MSPVLNKFNFCIEALLCLILTVSLIGIPHTLMRAPVFANILNPQPASRIIQHDPGNSYGALPLSFELNQGQTNTQVRFLARSGGYVFFLTATEAVMALNNPAAYKKGKENRESRNRTDDKESGESVAQPPRRIVRMKLEGANSDPRIEGLEQLPTTRSEERRVGKECTYRGRL